MGGRPVPIDVSESDIEVALSDVGAAKRDAWVSSSPRRRRRYVKLTRRFGGDPPELLALIADDSNRQVWTAAPWLIQREYCRWINKGWTLAQRQKRAAKSLVLIPDDTAML